MLIVCFDKDGYIVVNRVGQFYFSFDIRTVASVSGGEAAFGEVGGTVGGRDGASGSASKGDG